MTETELKRKVIAYLRNQKGVWFYKSSDRYLAGLPDIIGCYKTIFFGIELKTRRGRVKKVQEMTMKQMEECGAIVSVCRSVDEVKEFFDVVRNKRSVKG